MHYYYTSDVGFSCQVPLKSGLPAGRQTGLGQGKFNRVNLLGQPGPILSIFLLKIHLVPGWRVSIHPDFVFSSYPSAHCCNIRNNAPFENYHDTQMMHTF